MSKRKFRKGDIVKSLDDFLKHEYFIVNGKTFCAGWCRSWPITLAQEYIRRGLAYVAVRLTNGEYHANMTDEQIKDMLDVELCAYCPLDDKRNCDGICCNEAIDAWKEEGYVQ